MRMPPKTLRRKLQTGNYTNSWLSVSLIALILLTGCNKKFSYIFDRNSTRLVVNDAKFDFLSSKAKINFESEKNNVSGSANIRIRKDSIIWVSLSPGLGIEAARVLITTDSVTLLDKINKVFMKYSFAELSKKLDFDLNYGLVESAMLGNLVYPYDRERLVRTASTYAYSQQHSSYLFENFIGATSMKLEKIQVLDTLSRNTISVNYTDFQLVDEEVFPFQISAILEYAKKGTDPVKVSIEFKQTEIEKKPLKFPFNIPQRYDRK